MAKNTLPVDFKDDIMNSSMGGKRRYRMINNSDGTISLEDVTKYDQVGSNFGASQMNATNEAVNAAADAGKIIDDIDAINNVTQEGYIAGARALKQVNNSLTASDNLKFQFATDGEGRYGYLGADDSFIPFKSGGDSIILASNGVTSYTFDRDYDKVYVFVTNGQAQNYASGLSKPTCTSSEISITEISKLLYTSNVNGIVLYELSNVKAGQSASFSYQKHMLMIDGLNLNFELIASIAGQVNITTDKDYKYVVAVTSLSSVQNAVTSTFTATSSDEVGIIARNLANYATGNANRTSIKMLVDLKKNSTINIKNSGNGSVTDNRYANIVIGLY